MQGALGITAGSYTVILRFQLLLQQFTQAAIILDQQDMFVVTHYLASPVRASCSCRCASHPPSARFDRFRWPPFSSATAWTMASARPVPSPGDLVVKKVTSRVA